MKRDRFAKIIELISRYEVETQTELADLLKREGFNATQATVSRDIKQLKLTKIMDNNGRYKYALLDNPSSVPDRGKYNGVLTNGFISMDTANSILVIKTVSGLAMAVAAALDELSPRGMVGCIAGDDTVMCAVKSEEDAEHIKASISEILASGRKK